LIYLGFYNLKLSIQVVYQHPASVLSLKSVE
jgi:hypothetical protein